MTKVKRSVKAAKLPVIDPTTPRKITRGKAWFKKFAGGDAARLAAFRVSTSVRSTKDDSVLMSRFVEDPAARKEVAAVLRERYPRIKVQVSGKDYKLTRQTAAPDPLA